MTDKELKEIEIRLELFEKDNRHIEHYIDFLAHAPEDMHKLINRTKALEKAIKAIRDDMSICAPCVHYDKSDKEEPCKLCVYTFGNSSHWQFGEIRFTK